MILLVASRSNVPRSWGNFYVHCTPYDYVTEPTYFHWFYFIWFSKSACDFMLVRLLFLHTFLIKLFAQNFILLISSWAILYQSLQQKWTFNKLNVDVGLHLPQLTRIVYYWNIIYQGTKWKFAASILRSSSRTFTFRKQTYVNSFSTRNAPRGK